MALAPGAADGVGGELVALERLKLDPDNARVHNPRNLAAVKASLARFGQQKPVVASRDGIVYAGNGTLLAARDLGWPSLAVKWTNLQGDEARAYALADNRSNELSFFDETMLAEQLNALPPDLARADRLRCWRPACAAEAARAARRCGDW